MQLRPHQERTLEAMRSNVTGTVFIPTGGGKTICMIKDLEQRLYSAFGGRTLTIVCAPRIMLAIQLAQEFDANLPDNIKFTIGSVHSGDSPYWSSTDTDEIEQFIDNATKFKSHTILFTTYHSLHKIKKFGKHNLFIDHLYCDEAHNATQRNFFPVVSNTALNSMVSYFFTATPKYSTKHERGLNNQEVFGDNLITVSADELLECGSIIPPTVNVHTIDSVRSKKEMAHIDADTIIHVVDAEDAQKVLVAAPSARIINQMLSHTDLYTQLKSRGYTILRITSKHGAWIDDKKVNRTQFFDQLHALGAEDGAKFVLLHYSILSEGINVAGLTNVVLLRNLGVVEMAQTIGRVIRLDKNDREDITNGTLQPTAYQNYRKPTGFVSIPVYSNYGKNTAGRVQRTVNTIFNEGKPATAWI